MISVCIPVFNFKIQKLVKELTSCFYGLNLDYELLLIDDASESEYKRANSFIKDGSVTNIKYIELDKNIGRAAIRNLFTNYASFECLLFLDCDSVIANKNFISKYWQAYCNGAEIVCGGRIYENRPSESKCKLRWKVGRERECFPADIRQKRPFHSFMTNNFLIKKSIFKKVKFNEDLVLYGHEDSLFGFHLSKIGVNLVHVDNPTIHDFNETTREFLQKTKDGVNNLNYINSKILTNREFEPFSKLLAIYNKIEALNLNRLLYVVSKLTLPVIALVLRTPFANLILFDLYKLFYLCIISNRNQN